MIGCHWVAGWLHRDATGLDEAERLRLEDHLEACAACRENREHLVGAKQLVTALPIRPLDARGHQRAISRALLEGARPAPEPTRRTPYVVALGAVALAATLLVWYASRPDGDPIRSMPLPIAIQPSTAHSQDAPDAIRSAPTALPAATYAATVGDTFEASGVRVRVTSAGSLKWSAADRTIHIEDASLIVEVDPALRAPLRASTARFVVEVTGTIFEVSKESVTVQRGSVRIRGPRGAIFVEQLAAGQSWQLPTDTSTVGSTATSTVGSTDTSTVGSTDTSTVGSTDGSTDTDSPSSAPTPQVIAATWLARARAAFAAKRYAEAERHAAAALAASPSRLQAAEAHLVRAESAQASGRLDEAVGRYRAIAARYRGLPAAEVALFAAARIELGRRRDVGKRLSREYLDTYPTGRFADEARRNLPP